MFYILGPCVIESREHTLIMAKEIASICDDLGLDWYFKSSYDKANRSELNSYRGPGIDKGLDILSRAKNYAKVTTDVHDVHDVWRVAEVVDMIQIPAFLCRQTDLLVLVGKAARTLGKEVNVKKGQFYTGYVNDICDKVDASFHITERGTQCGSDLIVDFRNIQDIKDAEFSVIFDATHTAQNRKYVPGLAKAAAAVGVDGIFMEVHDDPVSALCDGKNMLKLSDLRPLLIELERIGGGP